MCEICSFDPDEVPIEMAFQIASTFHEEQGDGLGVVMAKVDGDKFKYETYKTTTPHWQTFFAFLNRHYSDTWRVVIHGRAKTSGQVNRETAHPIHVDCDHCEFDYVIHNGHVRNYTSKQENLIEAGHDLNTGVDTEVIAHKVGELPDSVSNHKTSTYSVYGNLNYLLFSENGILVHTDQKYTMDDSMVMTCSYNSLTSEPEEYGFIDDNENEWLLATPDPESEDGVATETKNRTVYYTNRSGSRGQNWSSSSGSTTQSNAKSRYYRDAGDCGSLTDSPRSNKVTVKHEDLSEWEFITAVKVAPGALRVIDKEQDEETYVFRDKEPKLYYWYLPDEEPDDFEEESGTETDGISTEAVSEAVAEDAVSTIAEKVDEVDGEELQEVRDDVLATAEASVEASKDAYKQVS